MRSQLVAFLEDPEGYDQRRQLCDRITLARAVLAEVEKLHRERREMRACMHGAMAALTAFDFPPD